MSILLVEYPKSPKKKTFLEEHPFPWHLGESKTGSTSIVDANYRRVYLLQVGFLTEGCCSSEIAEILVKAVNSQNDPAVKVQD